MTNLKQKVSRKEQTIINMDSKGHKSRNSMLPKSYTEFTNYQRREQEAYSNLNQNKFNMGQVPEERILRKDEDFKSSNPYSNVRIILMTFLIYV